MPAETGARANRGQVVALAVLPRARTHQPGVECVDGHHPEDPHYVALYVRLAVVRQMHVDAIYAYRHCHKASQNGAENTTQRPRRQKTSLCVFRRLRTRQAREHCREDERHLLRRRSEVHAVLRRERGQNCGVGFQRIEGRGETRDSWFTARRGAGGHSVCTRGVHQSKTRAGAPMMVMSTPSVRRVHSRRRVLLAFQYVRVNRMGSSEKPGRRSEKPDWSASAMGGARGGGRL